jgi:hypothetical protein
MKKQFRLVFYEAELHDTHFSRERMENVMEKRFFFLIFFPFPPE